MRSKTGLVFCLFYLFYHCTLKTIKFSLVFIFNCFNCFLQSILSFDFWIIFLQSFKNTFYILLVVVMSFHRFMNFILNTLGSNFFWLLRLFRFISLLRLFRFISLLRLFRFISLLRLFFAFQYFCYFF